MTGLPRTALVLASVLTVAGLAACAEKVDAPSAAAPSSSPTVSCPAPVTTTTAGEQQTVTSGGLTRTYNVWLPAGYTGTTPVPLILDFHGAAGEAVEYTTGFSGMAQRGPARGYLVVAPQGVQGNASGVGWKSPGSGTEPDDAQFTSDLIKAVSAKWCVDPQRYYATGFSSGGAFTTYVSCVLDAWGAVAPMAGANLVQPCPTRPPVAVVTFHGTTDTFVPYTSDVPASLPDPNAFYLGDVATVVNSWATRNGCQQPPTPSQVVPTVTRTTFAGCEPGDDVVLYTIEGAGHTYPGGKALPAEAAGELGGQSQAIDAAEVLLDFFDDHRRTTPPNLTPVPWTTALGGSASPAAPTPSVATTP